MLSVWRTTLCVPATRSDRFVKAASCGADFACIDLEDAVSPHDKDSARENALSFLVSPPDMPSAWALRINSPHTEVGLKDVLALLGSGAVPQWVEIPMVTSAEELCWLDNLLTEAGSRVRLVAGIETNEGLVRTEEIATAAPRLAALSFGNVDFAADTGCGLGWDAMLHARGRIVAAAARARIPALDGVWLDIPDTEGLRDETGRIRDLGFSGKIAIHPSQVAPINECFAPTPAEIERARRIVSVADASDGGVITVDGQMIDRPVIAIARRILAAAGEGARQDVVAPPDSDDAASA